MSDTVELAAFLVADISTAHISESDNSLLQEDSKWYLAPVSVRGTRLHVCPKDRGWWVWANDDPEMRKEARAHLSQRGYSEALLNLIDLAAAGQCDWICLDADGVQCPGLPTFDW